MTDQEYQELARQHAPRSHTMRNLLRAFLSGGAICAVSQAVLALFLHRGLSREDAGSATSITLIFIGTLLTGLGVYDRMAKFAGAGTLVPITGFANSVAAPALEFKTEGFILGTAVKMFSIAGPVIVYGVAAGIVYGAALLLLGVV